VRQASPRAARPRPANPPRTARPSAAKPKEPGEDDGCSLSPTLLVLPADPTEEAPEVLDKAATEAAAATVAPEDLAQLLERFAKLEQDNEVRLEYAAEFGHLFLGL
jgi:hypothetical protein